MMMQLDTRREVEREPEQRQLLTQHSQLQQRVNNKQVCNNDNDYSWQLVAGINELV